MTIDEKKLEMLRALGWDEQQLLRVVTRTPLRQGLGAGLQRRAVRLGRSSGTLSVGIDRSPAGHVLQLDTKATTARPTILPSSSRRKS